MKFVIFVCHIEDGPPIAQQMSVVKERLNAAGHQIESEYSDAQPDKLVSALSDLNDCDGLAVFDGEAWLALIAPIDRNALLIPFIRNHDRKELFDVSEKVTNKSLKENWQEAQKQVASEAVKWHDADESEQDVQDDPTQAG